MTNPTASLLPPPRFVVYDPATGDPLVGGFVYTYVPGGTVPAETWQDAAQATPNSNPIVLDAAGSCLLYGAGAYQITVTDSVGNAVPGYSGLTVDTLELILPITNTFSPAVATIAALRSATTATLPQAQCIVLGYYGINDGGQGGFSYNAADTTSADDAGTIIVDASGRRWLRQFSGPVNVQYFGATLNGASDDTAAWQAAVNYVCATRNSESSGGVLFMPPGASAISAAITGNGPIVIQGSGAGLGTGTGNTGGSVIITTSATDDVFTFTTPLPVQLRDLTVWTLTTRTGGAGITITGGAALNLGSKIERCEFIGQVTAIDLVNCANYTVRDNVISNAASGATGLWEHSTVLQGDVGGALIDNNEFAFTLGGGAGVTLSPSNRVTVSNNRFVGADYGVKIVANIGPLGAMLIGPNNSFRQQYVWCVHVSQGTSGIVIDEVSVDDNELTIFQSGSVPPSPQGAVMIAAGAQQYITKVSVQNNLIVMGHSTAVSQITVNDGFGVTIADNVIDCDNMAGPLGISVGGYAGEADVRDNIAAGIPSGKYGSLTTTTRLYDTQGMNFADLPPTAGIGSFLVLLDGQCTSSTNSVAKGGGSGCTTHRIRGGWFSDQYGVTG